MVIMSHSFLNAFLFCFFCEWPIVVSLLCIFLMNKDVLVYIYTQSIASGHKVRGAQVAAGGGHVACSSATDAQSVIAGRCRSQWFTTANSVRLLQSGSWQKNRGSGRVTGGCVCGEGLPPLPTLHWGWVWGKFMKFQVKMQGFMHICCEKLLRHDTGTGPGG